MTALQLLTKGLRFPEGPVAMPDGSLIVVEIEGKRLTRVASDGTRTTIAEMEGGPNGAAIGPDGKCYVCNNGGFEWFEDDENGLRPGLQPADYTGGRIERVDLETGEIELLYSESDAGPLRGPNDIVFDRTGGFWFTDIGKNRPGEREHGAVYYARTDGSMIRREIYPMVQPNGVGLSPDEKRLYVAETVTGRVWAFDLPEPGRIERNPFPSPNGGKLLAGLPGFQLFDSLAIDADGNVCVATMFNAGITVISPAGEILGHVPTGDPFTTNICFGGPDLRTAYITLSSRGEVVTTEWPRPGLPLNFLNL